MWFFGYYTNISAYWVWEIRARVQRLQEEVLHTHTHTHTYIYIYVYIYRLD